MPTYHELKQIEDCTCVDPLTPGKKMLQCGSDACIRIKEFYRRYLEDANRNQRDDNLERE